MATLIDGKAMAQQLTDKVAADVDRFINHHGFSPGLAVVLVGEDPASEVYVRNKVRRAGEAGLRSIEHRLPADTDQATLNGLIDELNAASDVHGILVQLPLPSQLSEAAVIARIRADKDVDGFHPLNVGALASGTPALVPCTPLGCLMMLKQQLGDLSGLNAVVIGRSNIVGKPMAALLLGESCTVTLVHSRSREIEKICAGADILVAAVGVPQLVKADWIKPGAVVIDVGINAVERDGKRRLVGDVDFTAAEARAAAITPVPGGVGPMTIACLMQNTLLAAEMLLGQPSMADAASR